MKSIEDHGPITLTLFSPKFDKEIRGIVMSVDRQLRQVKLRWLDDVVKVTT